MANSGINQRASIATFLPRCNGFGVSIERRCVTCIRKNTTLTSDLPGIPTLARVYMAPISAGKDAYPEPGRRRPITGRLLAEPTKGRRRVRT